MRLGSYQGPTQIFGRPSNVVHPTDNDITPSRQQAEADAAKAKADDLFSDLLNALRDPNADQAKVTPKP